MKFLPWFLFQLGMCLTISNRNPNSGLNKQVLVFVLFFLITRCLQAGCLVLGQWLHNVKDLALFSCLDPPSLACCLWTLCTDAACCMLTMLKARKQKEKRFLPVVFIPIYQKGKYFPRSCPLLPADIPYYVLHWNWITWPPWLPGREAGNALRQQAAISVVIPTLFVLGLGSILLLSSWGLK